MTPDPGSGPPFSSSLTRANRLLQHADFQRVYKQGRRHFATHLTAFYLRRESEAQPLRIGFTVSKALGGAVDRNRMKRRLREAVRKQFPATALAMDVVINPKKSLLKADFVEIVKDVAGVFIIIQKASRQKASEQKKAEHKATEQTQPERDKT